MIPMFETWNAARDSHCQSYFQNCSSQTQFSFTCLYLICWNSDYYCFILITLALFFVEMVFSIQMIYSWVNEGKYCLINCKWHDINTKDNVLYLFLWTDCSNNLHGKDLKVHYLCTQDAVLWKIANEQV